MLDDATLLRGRQTKRKWSVVWALLGAAALSLSAAWLTARPDVIQRKLERLRSAPAAGDTWLTLPQTEQVAAADFGLLCAGRGQLWALDFSGETLWRTDTALDEPLIQVRGGYAAVFEPGSCEILLASERGCETLTMPRPADFAAVGPQGQVAAVSSGSGLMTETRLYAGGALYKTVGMTDRAMALAAFLEDGALVSCCVDRQGRWSLRLDGEEALEVPLEAELVYDLKSCGDGLALWTSGGVSFYDRTGRETGAVSPEGAALDWACGDCAALLLRRDGAYRLAAVDAYGRISGETELDRRPVALAVCGERICLLDRERLLVYDDTCVRTEQSSLGARAGALFPAERGAVLTGDGQALYHAIP